MKPLFIALFLLPACLLNAQVSDNFTDGNFTANPTWTGNDTDFTVNASFQLQLNSTGNDTSYLSTPNTYTLNNCEWNFWIRLNFSPSGGNYSRVYLVSDQQNVQGSLNGYYLQFGEALANDQVELFRQTGTTSVSVCRGTTNISAAFSIRVKVTRDAVGNWALLIDPTGGINYVQEATGTDVTHTSTAFLGWNCLYTSSNSNDMFLDDVYVGPIIVDTTPPSVDSVAVITQNQIDVYFSEDVDLTTSQVLTNYSVNNSIGNPMIATRDVGNFALVHLTIPVLTINTMYQLTTINVQDLLGNAITTELDTFYYTLPGYLDIIINELMPDPDPPQLLPNYEYIELHNPTALPFVCQNFTITVGTNVRIIPDFIIYPDSFVVLTSTTGAPLFTGISVIAVTSFPSLTNTGNTVTLKNSFGSALHSVSYTDQWYQDVNKQDGGWSLEQIDPTNPCLGSINWRASMNSNGGTPGVTNSVLGTTLDNVAPVLLRAEVLNPTTLLAYFSETIAAIPSWAIFSGLSVTGTSYYNDDHSVLLLSLNGNVLPNTTYQLQTSACMDCAGNTSGTMTVNFGIAEAALAGDLIINELMPDPRDGSVEWIEIYNNSQKILDLGTISICSQDTITNTLTEISPVYTGGFVVFPGDHVLLSEDNSSVCGNYTCPGAGVYVNVNSLPSMSNDGDIVVIIDSANTILDKVVYSSAWHFSLLNDTKGVSLERISYSRPTQDATNWHSAAETAGFATPGAKNSQYSDAENSGELTISPEVFSPDNDGTNDVVNFSFVFDKPGFVGNVKIFDSRGRLVRKVWSNELLGTAGTVSWDGTNDNAEKAAIGIYIVYFEAFHADGEIKKFKKAFVLAGKL